MKETNFQFYVDRKNKVEISLQNVFDIDRFRCKTYKNSSIQIQHKKKQI